MERLRMIAVGALLGTLVACNGGFGDIDRETLGTGAGAVLGGVVGGEVGDGTTGVLIGGVLGAVLGREVARRMEAADEQNAVSALESNEPRSWSNPDTDADYRVNPTETFRSNGRVCREYTTTVRIEGELETAEGTACKQADGTWEVVG